MSRTEEHFVEVILPLAVGGTFTYQIPDQLLSQVKVGVRVVVQFARGRKSYSAVVVELHQRRPERVRVKLVLSVLDEGPVVLPHQLQLWKYIADHYMCHLGEVMAGRNAWNAHSFQ